MPKHQKKPPQHDIFGPGWGSDERPDLVTQGETGHQAFWFRPQSVEPPSRYDVGVPHRSKSGWMVYILFLSVLVIVGACLVGGSLFW